MPFYGLFFCFSPLLPERKISDDSDFQSFPQSVSNALHGFQ